ncbi:hypothetical protein [Paenibacillus prosopidis]|uniref:hypothetical protein n=1 Tax=Paenibacillus prosopidis TaxID=630520 RepID=UPI0011C07804|nr:hypothetical protein [Paenibacillus prosopidis]
MGEEKPDEELMGKRKSSPRLSTASRDADDFILSALRANIHFKDEKYFYHIMVMSETSTRLLRFCFINKGIVWYDKRE